MSVESLQAALREKEREIEALSVENRKLTAKLGDAEAENEDLRKQVRELKLQPLKRTYVDPDDERESNAWREKANNLLSLLDNLQHDMRNDLRDLEAETFSPGSARVARPAESAPTESPSRTVDAGGESSRKRKESRRRRREEREKSKATTDEAAPAETTVSIDEARGNANTSYKKLSTAAKFLHAIYKKIKDHVANDAERKAEWGKVSDPIKQTAKSAKTAGGKSDEVVDVGGANFSSNAAKLAAHASDWVRSAKSVADARGGSQGEGLRSKASELSASVKKFQSTAERLDPNGGKSVQAHADAADALAEALQSLMSVEGSCFGV